MPKHKNTLQPAAKRVSRAHFLLVALLSAQIVAYDAWQLITPKAVMQRWFAVGALFLVVAFCAYQASSGIVRKVTLRHIVWLLVIADIIFASYYVYLTRGMASREVILYAVPIITAMVLMSKRALVLSALLSITAYVLTAITYASINFNEGYKIELYGEVFFFSGVMLVLASLLWAIVHAKKRF
jgi:hypothetical protein